MSRDVSRQSPAAGSRQTRQTPAAHGTASSHALAARKPPLGSGSPRQLEQSRQMTQLREAAPTPPSPSSPPGAQGLPPGLRTGIEALSGLDMSGVRVHRNSSRPAALQAHAFAQGQDIHLAPSQDQHLPHEAWHVVQQAQGRVQQTLQHQGVSINDEAPLEREADVMGARAAAMAAGVTTQAGPPLQAQSALTPARRDAPVQRLRIGQFDSERPEHREYILEYLDSLGIDGLLRIANALHVEQGVTANYYIQFIQGRLSQLKLKEATDYDSINVSILISIDGVPFYSTRTYKAGDGGSAVFSMPPQSHQNREEKEYIISAKDAEAQAADEAWREINRKFPARRHYGGGVNIVTFTVIGNYGPCDGCKDRIELLRSMTAKRIESVVGAQGIPVTVERVYQEDVKHKHRGNRDHIPTTYGHLSDARVPIFGFTHTGPLPEPTLDMSKPLDEAFSYGGNTQSYPMSSYTLPKAPEWPPSQAPRHDRFHRGSSDDLDMW
ncbi:eCIS core domain-containing protein [Roseateles sp. DB2]|uniref:eCIS core domain-containing protein n=1 Tax=Roseateles sp. DB2 TaxID=3453717 RepID=UPI003EEF1A75